MKNEKYAEHLVLKEMGIEVGKNDFGNVFPQGDAPNYTNIQKALKEAGGKPKYCELNEFNQGGKRSAKPEFIITFDQRPNTIIVIECKNNISKHESGNYNKPKDYAVDGVLYYAKFLKKYYNVIAIAFSGPNKVDTFYWKKDKDNYEEGKFKKISNNILKPVNYLKFLDGEKIKSEFSIDKVRDVALKFHNSMRELGITEKEKPLILAGFIIALSDNRFREKFNDEKEPKDLISQMDLAINNQLIQDPKKPTIDLTKVEYIKSAIKSFQKNNKLQKIALGEDNSILWYLNKLNLQIMPMLDSDFTVDVLGEFYHEFIKYSGGDGKGLGIVLTPKHITEFMVELLNLSKDSKVLDPTCGSGSFLVSAMNKMLIMSKTKKDKENIKKNGLYGVEINTDLWVLSMTNMIIRKDGKSNIINGDFFDENIKNELLKKNITHGLLNPPYAQKQSELSFLNNLLDIVTQRGLVAAIVPLSSAIGTKFKEERSTLMSNHTLKAVFTMPDDVFYPVAGVNTCVMLWEAKIPHNSNKETFFGFYKDDGYVKKKKLGRVDDKDQWKERKKEWLELYNNNDEIPGKSAKHCVRDKDEWLAEAYMETDYSDINEDDFIKILRDYNAFLIKSGDL